MDDQAVSFPSPPINFGNEEGTVVLAVGNLYIVPKEGGCHPKEGDVPKQEAHGR